MTELFTDVPVSGPAAVVLLTLSREEADPLLAAGLTGKAPEHIKLSDRYTPRENWHFHRNAVALLVADLGGLHDPARLVVGIAYADVLKAGAGTTRRPVRLLSSAVISPAIPLTAALERSSTPLQEAVGAALKNLAQPLPPTIGSELVRRLDELQPGVADQIERMSRPDRLDDSQSLYTRDRISTLLRFAGYRGLAHAPELQVDGLPPTLDAVRKLWESEIIAEDSLRFPGWDLSAAEPGAWLRFEREKRTLFLKNIDAKPGEQATGGDIVYLRKDPDSVVVVQYKRAAVKSDGTTAYCRVDERLRGQLDRLISLDQPVEHPPAEDPPAEDRPAEDRPADSDYRLSRRVGFVKLVEDRPKKTAPGEVFRGYYFPADFLLQRLKRSGRSAVDVDPTRDRYIDSLTFVSLVAGGWIGSSGPLTNDILRRLYAEQLIDPSRPTTVAYDEPTS